MLCEKCKENIANTHVKRLNNDEYIEYHLCEDCARELGYTSILSNVNEEFENFLGSFFSNALPERSGATRCPKCGLSYNDILARREIGCSQCYDTFKKELSQSISRLHHGATHKGKIPDGFKAKLDKEEKVKALNEQLNIAVEKQDFENAAKIRDEIKEVEDMA